MLSLKNLFPKFNTFEKLLWTISVAGVTVLFMFVPQKNPLTLIATITGVTSLIFVAKGNVIGQFLIVVFSVLYSIVSLEFHYYGEMITYLFMSTPSAIFTAVLWLKNPAGTQKVEVKMAHLTPKKSATALILTVFATVIFYFVLKALNTANLEISTISIATSMSAAVLMMMRVPYYAVAYSANDIVLILMWLMASCKNPVYFPMVFNFMIFLANDIYGFVSWKRIRGKQERA